ncbi:MAG: hypothetical protein FWF84_07395, partial [Kiritimatiellaeota bacterium]|nr:hypothetical protein [Kiritimatiellota bacterium]
MDNNNNWTHDRACQDVLRLFEEASFGQRMRRMLSGLGKPKASGEYKFARLQLQRLSAPFLAVMVPLALLIAMLSITPSAVEPPTGVPIRFEQPTNDVPLDPPPDPIPSIDLPDDPLDPTKDMGSLYDDPSKRVD